MEEKLSVRLAKEQDFQDVLKVSEGLHDGNDYLRFVFHQWLKTPGKYMFVGELHEKIIAFEAATVIDDGQTIYYESLRIHQEYRGRGFSYQMRSGVLNQVLHVNPGASKVRYMTLGNNPQMKRLSQRLGYKLVMKKQLSSYQIPKQLVVQFRGFHNARKELHELKKENAVEFVLEQRKFDHIIPCQIMVASKDAYELMPANAEKVFKDNDKIFAQETTDELRQGLTPRSLSHGRFHEKVKQQTWVCNIYANERDVFKAHLIQHAMAAIDVLEKNGKTTGLEVLYSSDLAFDAKEVFGEIVDSQEIVTDCQLDYYEKQIDLTLL